MAYTPHTEDDIQEMMKAIGIKNLDELFRDVPESLLRKNPVDLKAHTEYETDQYFRKRAEQNKTVSPEKNFLGAGAYQHFIPAAIKALLSRGEFMTSYTPYQAEVSQGTLQAIFEFQSHICALTGMEVANASMYDGATALAEALTMAVRQTRKNKVAVPELLHPSYKEVVETFLKEIDVEITYIPASGAQTDYSNIDNKDLAAIVVGYPNALGTIEDGWAAKEATEGSKALLVAVCNPTALAILTPPSDFGADIVVGEAQPLGLPLNFGGPYCGYFACSQKLIRKMPGRIVGKTMDDQGNEGYVLTLQTREQHIRRDKATSNICTNQGLFALMTTMYMTFIGKQGLIEVAESSMANTHELVQKLEAEELAEVYDSRSPNFHEVAVRLSCDAKEFCKIMKDNAGIVAGQPLEDWLPNVSDANRMLLINCTELHTEEAINDYITATKSVYANLTSDKRRLAEVGGA